MPPGRSNPHLHRSRQIDTVPLTKILREPCATRRDVTHGQWITKQIGTDDGGDVRLVDGVPAIAWIGCDNFTRPPH